MSTHLESIVNKKEGISNLQVVFIDIEKFSKRRTKIQSDSINEFTHCLRESLTELSQLYVEYFQDNNINLKEDTIIHSTGDGAMLIFTFDGLPAIHLEYAKMFLKRTDELSKTPYCGKLAEDGFCNDHSHFNVRIGISDGSGLVFRDMNNQFNAVGDVVNMASRVMNLADRNQIALTSQARDKIIDIAYEQGLDNNFIKYPQIKIKHDLAIDIYQYIDDLPYINSTPLSIRKLSEEMSAEREQFDHFRLIKSAGFVKLYPNRQEFFNELFSSILKNASYDLKIMGICVSLFRESDKPLRGIEWNTNRAANLLSELAMGECNIKILFLKRYLSLEDRKYYGVGSQGDFYFMRERDEDVEYDFRRGRRLKIISNIAVGKFINVAIDLGRRTESLDIGKRRKIMNCLDIREYIGLPAISLYIVDNDIYMTPYLYKRHCSTVPAFQFTGPDTDLFKDYNAHFDAVWKNGQTSPIIHPAFLDSLINEPTKTLGLFSNRIDEIRKEDEARIRKSPSYIEDPEYYRAEEKAIMQVVEIVLPSK